MSVFETVELAVLIVLPVIGAIWGGLRWALRKELHHQHLVSSNEDDRIKRDQEQLGAEVKRAHERIDDLSEKMDEAVHRRDYVPAMALLNQKIDALSQAMARLEERTTK